MDLVRMNAMAAHIHQPHCAIKVGNAGSIGRFGGAESGIAGRFHVEEFRTGPKELRAIRDGAGVGIRNRLSVYESQTAPVFDWYKRNGTRVVTVDAKGTMDDITKRALKALGR